MATTSIFSKRNPFDLGLPKTNQSNQNPFQSTIQTTSAPKSIYGMAPGAIGSKPGGGYIYPSAPMSTYKPPVTNTPQPENKVATSAPSATDTYIKNIQDRGQSRIQEQGKTLQDYLTAIKEQNDLRLQESEAQKADEQSRFDRFANTARAGAEDVAKASQGLKEVTTENYGSALRRGAEAGREQEALLTGRFAGNNTLDSSAFQNAMINSKAGLVGGQQSILNEQARKLNDIDASVVKAKRDAEALISEEGAKLQTTLRQIANTYAQGSIEYRNAVTQAYQLANENVNAIKDNLDQLSYNAEQEKLKAGNADNLSEQFLTTGVPQTMNDLIFRQKNPDEAKSIYEQAQSQGGAGKNTGEQKALNLVDDILGGNYQAISGGFRPGNVPVIRRIFGGGQESAKWDGLRNLLSLAGRGELKGSGAVSDFEAKMLEKAALAGLDPTKQSEDEFYAGLQQLKADLERGGATSSIEGQIRVKNLQTGETGTIPVSEFDPSLYQQI